MIEKDIIKIKIQEYGEKLEKAGNPNIAKILNIRIHNLLESMTDDNPIVETMGRELEFSTDEWTAYCLGYILGYSQRDMMAVIPEDYYMSQKKGESGH